MFFNDKNFVKVTNYDYPRIRLARVKAYKVMKFLYKDTPVFLERKFSNFKNFSLPDKKYNKPYKYIRKLPSNRYFIKTPSINKKQYTIGTFDTIEEAINANMLLKSLDYMDEEEISMHEKVGFIEQGYNEEILDLKEELKHLSSPEKRLIKERYENGHTQNETSKILGISQVQVSRKEKEILTRLRARLQ